MSLIIGNWKMNGSLAANQELLQALKARLNTENTSNKQVVVSVPFPYLLQVKDLLNDSPITLAAQDISLHENGAYTGEVSGAMLADVGCKWVIVGHSERRSYHNETDQQIAQKAQAAINAGLKPIVCIGETLEQQKSGNTLGVIASQLAPVLALGTDLVKQMVIAYEPVWAIGTGLTATPDQAQQVHVAIRASLNSIDAGAVKILYGGSVNASNAKQLFAMPDINGALVGGASLDAQQFYEVIIA